MKLIFDDGNQDVNADGAPDLRLRRVSTFHCDDANTVDQVVNGQSFRPRSSIFVLMAVAVLIAQLCGCEGVHQYREDQRVAMVTNEKNIGCQLHTPYENCEMAEQGMAINGLNPYFLGYVEFDDSGLLFKDGYQLKYVISELKNRILDSSKYSGVIEVVFAHGWTHNARAGDENIKTFRELLQDISGYEQNRVAALGSGARPRLVAGVYLGWRGQSLEIPGLSLFTFKGRKDSAERVGVRDGTSVVLQLRDVAYSSTPVSTGAVPNRFVVVGHSMGADLLYSAVAPFLEEQIIDPPTKGNPRFADGVVFLNGALEAAHVLPLLQLAARHPLTSEAEIKSHPAIAFFTSDSDFVTKLAFPLAMGWLSSQLSIDKNEYIYTQNPIRPHTSDSDSSYLAESGDDTLAIGHVDELTTHFLVSRDWKLKNKTMPCGAYLDSNANPSPALKDGVSEDKNSRHLAFSTTAKKTAVDQKVNNDEITAFGDVCLIRANPEYQSGFSGFKADQTVDNAPSQVYNVKMDPEIWKGHDFEQRKKTKPFLEFLERFITFGAPGDAF